MKTHLRQRPRDSSTPAIEKEKPLKFHHLMRVMLLPEIMQRNINLMGKFLSAEIVEVHKRQLYLVNTDTDAIFPSHTIPSSLMM